MQGSKPSKISKDLGHVRLQLKSGKTRGLNPRDLTADEISALEQRRDALLAEMRKAATERNISRINAHTSGCADRVANEVSTKIESATAESSSFFQAVNGAGSSTELRVQAAVLRARATEKGKEERLALKKAEQEAMRSADNASDSAQRTKRTRTEPPSDARNVFMRKSMPDLRALLSEKGLDTRGRAKTELVDRLMKAVHQDPPQEGGDIEASATELSSLAPPQEGLSTRTSTIKAMHIGTVVTLRGALGTSVPEEFKDVAVTVMDIDQEQNEIKFIADGKCMTWPIDDLEAVRARPFAIDPALEQWLQAAGVERRCGHFTKTNGFCSWTVPCKFHQKCEEVSMAREDERSRQAERGICGVTGRNGRICMSVRGDCRSHAPDELRCKSMLEDDMSLRCWCYKKVNSDYCSNHAEFSNLSVNARDYGYDCQRYSQPCSLHDFLERFYPAAKMETFPRRPEEFLAYVKRMSGHPGLWQIQYRTRESKAVAEVRRIVAMLLPVRGNAEAHAAHVNHTLSDKSSPLRVEAGDGGYTIGCRLKGERVEVAHLSSS